MDLLGAYVRRKRFEASLMWAKGAQKANEKASLASLSMMGFGVK